MATKLTYFEDTYKFNGTAKVLKVIDSASVEDADLSKILSKHPFAVIVDETLFYPQGGGQPTDVGQITSSDGATFNVSHVLMFQDKVYHQGAFASDGRFSVDSKVELKVDQETRLRNARCHSGGHVIFSIIKSTGWDMMEKKGHHFADGAYVEFNGVMPEAEDKDAFQKRVDDVVKNDVPVSAYTLDDGLRYIRVGEFIENPCGGTHVKSTGELGRIVIKKIARRKGQNLTKISYSIESPSA
ncbi:hypothetical protein GGI12_004781 [Dipsacomyces acuminosporus]|nr:hypothetical protein GGI12_004781 [Dipsacomyces acuminosporus]